MDAGEDLAAQKLAADLAAVADVLLPWLRADADSDDDPPLFAPVNGAEVALAVAASFANGDKLVLALRALLARAEVARMAAGLAYTSKEVCTAVRALNADLIDADGAARWAHAAALRRIVRAVAAAGETV